MIDSQTLSPIKQDQNHRIAKQALEELISQGVREFCLCPGGRNAPLIYPLANSSQVTIYNWPEERSAAFFALGRIKATGKPVAVVTTSGTAAGELLPATMEAHYTGLPLVLVTADRPRHFRGTGAPQSAEQVGLFGCYAQAQLDISEDEICDLQHWKRTGPLHLNLCFEEPNDSDCQKIALEECQELPFSLQISFSPNEDYLGFLKKTQYPLVVVGALDSSQHEAAIQYLLHLQAPIYLEGISGIREDPRLETFRITRMEKVWQVSFQQGYPIDGILRIGGIPTIRLWRDIELKQGQMPVCSISDLPFSGLSCAGVITTHLNSFFKWAQTLPEVFGYDFNRWKEADMLAKMALQSLFEEEPLAEQSLIHTLSKQIPCSSKVYLGNSLPIREWDLAATYHKRNYLMGCSRGLNGIDGQLSTFLGFCSQEQDNWGIFGDLTALYDLAAPWIMPQLPNIAANVVIINNNGAGIFKRMFAHPAFLNTHALSFEHLAKFWGWNYEQWKEVPDLINPSSRGRIIEIIPCPRATERFLQKLKDI